MSGHSKWSTIKRAKEKTDAQKGKIFTKIGRELAVVVREGGADVNTNNRLKDVIQKAKQSNMPQDSILKAIKKASGEQNGVNYESVVYEGYGVGGSAVICMCLTDNKNRTAGDVRHAFDKFGGSLGANGCVSYMFKYSGIIVVDAENVELDTLLEDCFEFEFNDVVEGEGVFVVYTSRESFSQAVKSLEGKYKIVSSELSQVPDNFVELDEKQLATFTKMMDTLTNLDDIQDVYHNVENYEE